MTLEKPVSEYLKNLWNIKLLVLTNKNHYYLTFVDKNSVFNAGDKNNFS